MDREVLFLIIGLFGGALISIPIGYFITFTSNPLANRFRDWRNRRAQDKAKQTVKKAIARKALLEKQLNDTTLFVTTPSAFVSYITLSLLRVFGFLLVFALFSYFTFAGLIQWTIENFDKMPMGQSEQSDLLIGTLFFLLLVMLASVLGVAGIASLALLYETLKFVLAFDKSKEASLKQIAELQEVIDQNSQPTERT